MNQLAQIVPSTSVIRQVKEDVQMVPQKEPCTADAANVDELPLAAADAEILPLMVRAAQIPTNSADPEPCQIVPIYRNTATRTVHVQARVNIIINRPRISLEIQEPSAIQSTPDDIGTTSNNPPASTSNEESRSITTEDLAGNYKQENGVIVRRSLRINRLNPNQTQN
jgi:hypothetical protein